MLSAGSLTTNSQPVTPDSRSYAPGIGALLDAGRNCKSNG